MTRSIHAACAGRLARRGDRRNDGAVGFAHRIWPAESAALAPIRREVERWLAPLDLPADVAADLVLAVKDAASPGCRRRHGGRCRPDELRCVGRRCLFDLAHGWGEGTHLY